MNQRKETDSQNIYIIICKNYIIHTKMIDWLQFELKQERGYLGVVENEDFRFLYIDKMCFL